MSTYDSEPEALRQLRNRNPTAEDIVKTCTSKSEKRDSVEFDSL